MPRFEPNADSLKTHDVPAWFHDAKFGVMVHWGLYSVPGWAERSGTIQKLWSQRGPNYYFKHNPYAEWYANTIGIEGSGAQRHHAATYGRHVPYDAFAPVFDEASATVDFSSWADLFAQAGARYAVLTTKHMDGYCLWPSSVSNPRKPGYAAARNIVADVTMAVRARGLRMGLYYSAGYDMTFNPTIIKDAASAIRAVPQDADFAEYAHRQLVELIEDFAPDVLWNDIAYPRKASFEELLARYYNAVPDGLVNDRWARIGSVEGPLGNALLNAVSVAIPGIWRFLPTSLRQFKVPQGDLFDFATPEYAEERDVVPYKWEAVRGIGPSFGNNRNETDADLPSSDDLIHTLVDIVSKNGNLLLGVGPEPNGDIPDLQQQRLRDIGAWLATNGEAIFETRPWDRAEGLSADGTPVRFTSRDSTTYTIVLGAIATDRFVIKDFALPRGAGVRILGLDAPLDWEQQGPDLSIVLPSSFKPSSATAFRLG